MAKRCLITGASGFTGRHLAVLCLERGLDVYGVSRHRHTACSRTTWIEAELSDPSQVRSALDLAKPDVIFHLAGVSKASTWADYLRENVQVTSTLLTMTATMFPSTKVLLVGSCAQYGRQSIANLPILEDHPLKPETEYGLSKCLQEEVGEQQAKNGLQVYLARPFNLIGPGQTGDFVAVSLMSKIRAAASACQESVHVNHLDSGRDFLDVRDCVRAYWDLLEKGETGMPYNVCSGRCITIRELYHAISETLGVFLQAKELMDTDTVGNSSGFRIYGDAGRLQERTGWHPSISLRQSLQDMLPAPNQDHRLRNQLTPQQS